MKKIEVVAAIVINDGKILCVQRNENKYSYISKKYEFPGGKMEEGETQKSALVREIKEELNMDIDIQKEFLTVKLHCLHIFSCHFAPPVLIQLIKTEGIEMRTPSSIFPEMLD